MTAVLQVRWTARANGSLRVHRTNRDDHFFVPQAALKPLRRQEAAA